jgi:hypothetical protein
VAIASALVLQFKFDAGWFTLDFGLPDTDRAVLGAFCLVLTASRIVDWKRLCCMLITLFLGRALWYEHPASPAALFGFGWDILIKQGMSGALLGVVLLTLWRDRDLPLPKRWRIRVFLAAVVSFQFVGALSYDFTVLGAAAFVIGFVWCGRGLVLGPLLIQLCGVVSLSVAALREEDSFGAFGLARLGAVAFGFGFFGLLSNRYGRLREKADSIPDSAIPERSKIGWTSIDITALAKVVRKLDISATIKEFGAVLAS